MGIVRLLAIVAIVWFAFRLYRGVRRTRVPRAGVQDRLVRCASCGVHLPLKDARRDSDDAPVCAHHQHR